MQRIAGLRGRKPARPVGSRFAIGWLHEYLAPPEPTYPIDASRGITDWGILGNDIYGDCGPAAFEHERMLGGAKPTDTETIDLYLAYSGGQDTGVVIADFLLWLYHQGLIEGFAPVKLKTVDAVMAQLQRGVLLGVNLTDDANDLFNQGLPWTVSNGEEADPAEGHAILKVKAETASGNGTCVTWGADQIMEQGWQKVCIEEAWAIVTKDDMSDAAYQKLLADLAALPHAQVTPPVPVPVPVPEPVPDVHGFLDQIKQIVQLAIDEIVTLAKDLFGAKKNIKGE